MKTDTEEHRLLLALGCSEECYTERGWEKSSDKVTLTRY